MSYSTRQFEGSNSKDVSTPSNACDDLPDAPGVPVDRGRELPSSEEPPKLPRFRTGTTRADCQVTTQPKATRVVKLAKEHGTSRRAHRP